MAQKNIKYTRQELDEAIDTIKSDLNILELQNCDLNTAYFYIDEDPNILNAADMIDGIYVKNIITEDFIKLNKKQENNPRFNVIKNIVDNIQSYCSIYNRQNNKLILKQLNKNTRKNYLDGTSSTNDITDTTNERDVWIGLSMPVYYKVESFSKTVKNNVYPRYRVTITTKSIQLTNGWQQYKPYTLIGVYKASLRNNKLYSISGVIPAKGELDYKTFVSNRGANFKLIDYKTHQFIALLAFGYYKTVDVTKICGDGTTTYVGDTYYPKLTGLTNDYGNNDTTPDNGSSLNPTDANIIKGYGDDIVSINCLGIENIYGDIYEQMGDIFKKQKSYIVTYLNDNTSKSIDITHSDGSYNTYNHTNCDTLNDYLYLCIMDKNNNILRAIGMNNQFVESGNISNLIFGLYGDIIPKTKINDYGVRYSNMGYIDGTREELYRAGATLLSWAQATGFVTLGTINKNAGNWSTCVGTRIMYEGNTDTIEIQ